MKIVETVSSAEASAFSSAELREQFLLTGLFRPGEVTLRLWTTERTVVGGIVPLADPLQLPVPSEFRAESFFERREGGILNLGGPGWITTATGKYPLQSLDALYLGKDTKQVSFGSDSAQDPARFYLVSYPAHASYPSKKIAFADVPGDRLGAKEGANERVIHRMIHGSVVPTCQLVMGVTRLAPGSVWNTMPPHTHLRRSEVYLYFQLPDPQLVFHFMGQPEETRHVVVRDSEVVLSPPWSIHCGVGTAAYSFVWAMGGENREFTDMDAVKPSTLR